MQLEEEAREAEDTPGERMLSPPPPPLADSGARTAPSADPAGIAEVALILRGTLATLTPPGVCRTAPSCRAAGCWKSLSRTGRRKALGVVVTVQVAALRPTAGLSEMALSREARSEGVVPRPDKPAGITVAV